MTVKVWNDSIIPAGTFARQPLGCILHGSRSDVAGRSPGQELASTITWARTNPKGLGWNATGGPDVYVTHLPASQWGWNAYEASALWLAYEFTQPTILDPITDAHVRAFVTWWQRAVLPVWPGLEPTLATLVCHSELPEGIREGKTDTFAKGDPLIADLKRRIVAAWEASVDRAVDDDDARLEAAYQLNKPRLGAKRFAGALRRDWGGKALLCERGALVVNAGVVSDVTARLIDDAVYFNESSGTLTRY